eukprot:scpid96587/ scgid18976/ 
MTRQHRREITTFPSGISLEPNLHGPQAAPSTLSCPLYNSPFMHNVSSCRPKAVLHDTITTAISAITCSNITEEGRENSIVYIQPVLSGKDGFTQRKFKSDLQLDCATARLLQCS